MRVPKEMENTCGLDSEAIKTELIDKVFLPRAIDDRYDEGLADLVNETQR